LHGSRGPGIVKLEKDVLPGETKVIEVAGTLVAVEEDVAEDYPPHAQHPHAVEEYHLLPGL